MLSDDDKRPNLRLKGHVQYAGLTDEQIAVELKWSVKKVSRVLSGETRLLVNHLFRFAQVLRKPVIDLLDDPPAAAAAAPQRRAS